jgi:hypothetical protein
VCFVVKAPYENNLFMMWNNWGTQSSVMYFDFRIAGPATDFLLSYSSAAVYETTTADPNLLVNGMTFQVNEKTK